MEHNIDTEQNKWIYLFSADTPERISRAATISEEFFEIICDISKFCMNVGEVFDMFSEALRIMDKNTQELMYVEAMEELTEVKGELTEAKEKLTETEGKLEKAETELDLVKRIYALLMSGKTLQEVAVQFQMDEERVKELLQ